MKASKEMQLKIIDKMRENVDSDQHVYTNIQVRGKGVLSGWLDKGDSYLDFWNCEHRVKPETVTINGVDIPKPICLKFVDDKRLSCVYFPVPVGDLYIEENAVLVCGQLKMNDGDLVYATKDEAIEASKALFGIGD